VRLNEPFGDVVNWDLVPDAAIERIDILPGSNPMFGLNALGGAVSIRTRSGRYEEGGGFHATADSLGLTRIEADAALSGGAWHGFVAGAAMYDEGWRDFSRSRHAQLFGKGGRVFERAVVDFSLAAAGGTLRGNGPVPADLLAEDRSAVFTHPDLTRNRAATLTSRAEWYASPSLLVEGNVFVRSIDTRRLNGDDSPYEECDDAPGLLCEEDSPAVVFSTLGSPIPFLLDGEPLDAANNRSHTRSGTAGATLQLHRALPLGGRSHDVLAGISTERSEIDFSSSLELATLTADRGAAGRGLYSADAAVDLWSASTLVALYLRDSVAVTERATLTGAIRHQTARLELRDRIGTALDGDHRFARLTASLGATFRLGGGAIAWGGVGEASRAPTAVELTCADPDDPCRLPNAFVSDPPLEQVKTTTWEGGVRGTAGAARWSGSLFRSTSRDDILFIASGATTGAGYFSNVGTTVREGGEIVVSSTPASRLNWSLGYALLDARFASRFDVPSPHHPLGDGSLEVAPGDRIPGLARHSAKLFASAPVGRSFEVELDGVYRSSQHLRGDEANLLPPIGGFAVFGAAVVWEATPQLSLRLAARNLFDRRYATFGLLGEPDDVLGDDYDDPRFLSPGAPRSIALAVRLRRR
jgi:iron complex outermembrane recepter protein